MRFKGSSEIEEFWSLLENESPRCLTIIVAAFFEEKLGTMLGKQKGNFESRINKALKVGLLTQNEGDDLNGIRDIRNSFAHNLRAKEFDADKSLRVNTLNIWKIAVSELPTYEELFPNAKERLLYVAATIAVRLLHRSPTGQGPLPEPTQFHDPDAWLSVTDL